MDISRRNYESLLREGIMAAKTNRHGLARRLLQQATRENPADARPWVWLSQITDDPEARRRCLERAVAADPANAVARRGLALLTGRLDPGQVKPDGTGFTPPDSPEPVTASAQVFSCPQCGGSLQFDLDGQNLTCLHCGRTERVELTPATEALEKPVDLVLPTQEGHRWAATAHRVNCERCGAVTVLPVGEATDQCPYCASHRLVESAAADELIDPHAIGMLKVKDEFALQAVKRWLGEGLYTPDDLDAHAWILDLRLAYYPFWTFDGSLEATWRCEIRQGRGSSARWVPRDGTEVVLFDDVLVPGWQGISLEETRSLGPFKLRELVVFEPQYLVGWPALVYNRSMADASLLAREQVVQDLRQRIARRVEPGFEKRNLQVGAGKWSGMSFKHVLLPLWVGSYRHEDQTFRLLVNGQTGVVVGEKPRDRVKIAMVWAGIGIAVVVLGLFAFLVWMALGGFAG